MERARNFCFTLNFDGADTWEDVERLFPGAEEAVKVWECKYLIFGRERGKESNILHLQGYVSFPNGKTLSALKKYSARAHWEVARGTPKQASEYCEKEGAVFEKGVRPLSQAEKGSAEKERWTSVINLARLGDVTVIQDTDPQAYLQYHSAIDKIASANKRKAVLMDEDPTCVWIWGPTGTGKSYYVDATYPDNYRKDVNNRNWGDYKDEDVVYYEDVDRSFAMYGGDLKRLADRTPFPVDAKYQTGWKIRPKVIVVTSNYHPCEIWADSKILSLIMRRFVLTKRTEVYVKPILNSPGGSEALARQPCVPSGERPTSLFLRTPDPAGAQRHAGGAAEERSDDNHGSPGRLAFMNANGW